MTTVSCENNEQLLANGKRNLIAKLRKQWKWKLFHIIVITLHLMSRIRETQNLYKHFAKRNNRYKLYKYMCIAFCVRLQT